MKNSLIVVMFLGLSLEAFAKDITISVKGMVCGFCAQGITKKFKAEESVENVQVSLEKKTVVVTLKKDQDIEDKKINEILSDSGYNVEKISR